MLTSGSVPNVPQTSPELRGSGDGGTAVQGDRRQAGVRSAEPLPEASPPSSHDGTPTSPAPGQVASPRPSWLAVPPLVLAAGKPGGEVQVTAGQQRRNDLRLVSLGIGEGYT